MNICTCVLYHEVLVYGVRHIYVIGAIRVHECGRTRIQIYAVCMIEIIRSSFLFHGFPRFLIPL